MRVVQELGIDVWELAGANKTFSKYVPSHDANGVRVGLPAHQLLLKVPEHRQGEVARGNLHRSLIYVYGV